MLDSGGLEVTIDAHPSARPSRFCPTSSSMTSSHPQARTRASRRWLALGPTMRDSKRTTNGQAKKRVAMTNSRTTLALFLSSLILLAVLSSTENERLCHRTAPPMRPLKCQVRRLTR